MHRAEPLRWKCPRGKAPVPRVVALHHEWALLTKSAVTESYLSHRMVDVNLIDRLAYDICDFRN